MDEVTTGNDEEFSVIRYVYNYLDMPVEVTNALGETESSHYDAVGNLISGVDYAGGTYEAVYDILGRMESEEKHAPGKTTLSKSFVYDEMSQIRSVTENEKTNTFEYDGKGLVIREEDDLVIKEFQYDYTGAVLVSKIYEESELLKETRTAYDKMSRPVIVSDGSVLKAAYSYDKGSRLIGTKYGNGLTETRTYNDAGLTKSVVNKDHAGTILSQYSYTYAIDGNQRSKTDAGGLTEYGYDGLNRLVKEKHTSGADITTSRYSYDENGNMTKKEVEGSGESIYEHYSYNEADQLIKQTGTKGQVLYSYDNNGNMLTKRTNGETVTQNYDAMNRLISWTDGEGEADYTYHINNKRASKMVDGLKTEHIWIGEEIQIDKIDGEMVSYVHGIRLIESDYGFYLYNAHGDVVQVVLENQIVSRYDYNAYGQMIGEYAEEEKDCNPYRYTGEYWDKETGYIYLRARYYDPEISRFLNVDPIKDGINWYGYTGGNPVRYTNPSGLRRKREFEGLGRPTEGGKGGSRSTGGKGRKFPIKEETMDNSKSEARELRMTQNGLQLLADIEVNTNSEYMVKEGEKITGIMTHDVGDGGLTVGYGFFIKGGMSNTDEINRLKSEYGIIVKEGVMVDIDKILKLYHEAVKKHEERAKEYVKARGLSPNEHEFDALVIQVYNGAHYDVMDAFGDTSLNEAQALEKALQTYRTFKGWEAYEKGWTNRLRNIINLYRNSDYTKLY